MDLPAVFFALRRLAGDTARQARASGVTAALLIATLVCSALCLTVSVQGDPPPTPGEAWEAPSILPATDAARFGPRDLEGVDVPAGEMSLLFGAIKVPLKRARAVEVRFIELILAGGVADTLGVLLALVWTAGFLPAFLDATTASVLFAKPLPRWAVLAGKIVSVLVLLAGQALLFIAGVWAALGLRTGVWDIRVFAAVPVMIVHFGCFFAVSAALAVATRSTVVSVVGTVLIWAGCWSVNFARQTGLDGRVLEAAYWLLPKPGDFGLLLVDALGANRYFNGTDIQMAATDLSPEAVLLTSLILPAVALTYAFCKLKRISY